MNTDLNRFVLMFRKSDGLLPNKIGTGFLCAGNESGTKIRLNRYASII